MQMDTPTPALRCCASKVLTSCTLVMISSPLPLVPTSVTTRLPEPTAPVNVVLRPEEVESVPPADTVASVCVRS
jgi:hypothetical protein